MLLRLLEGGADAVAVSVTVQAEGAEFVGDGVVVGENQDRRSGEPAENLADGRLHGPGEAEFGPLLGHGRDGGVRVRRGSREIWGSSGSRQ